MPSNAHVNERNGSSSALMLPKLLGMVFVLACLNPWTSFGTNSMDSQPWALIFGLLFIASIRRIRASSHLTILTLSLVLGMALSLMLSDNLEPSDVSRFVASYATLLIVYVGFYNYLLMYGFPRKLFLVAGWSWILFALVEIVVPSVTSILSSQRTSEGRGLTSLAPEPTFFAIFLIFFSWILYRGVPERFQRSDKIIVSISLLSVLVLARSAMGVLYLLVGISVFFLGSLLGSALKGRIKNNHIIAFTLCALIATFTFYFITSVMTDSRINKIISSFAEMEADDIVAIVRMDASIFIRVAHATVSVHSAILNLGLPGGMDTFIHDHREAAEAWGRLFWDFYPGNKIQSWNGVLLYELGIFGLISYAALISSARKKGGASWAEIVILILFLVGAIPIAFPLVPMLFALWAYLGDKPALQPGVAGRSVALISGENLGKVR